MKFFNKKTLLFVASLIGLVVISALIGVLIYFSSPEFKETARQYAIRAIEKETGGDVTIGRLYWNLWTQKVSVLDVTFRGMESPDSAPLAHIESIEAGVNIRSLFKRRIDLFELTVTRPEIHVTVDSTGNTNLPSPPPQDTSGRADFQVSIENFRVAQGSANINEQRFNLDFVLRNLESDLSYKSATRILNAHLSFDGVLKRTDGAAIPYSLASDFDFTRGTILAKHFVVTTGKSSIQLQGVVNDALTSGIAGKLEYTGTAAVEFMNYFFPKETFSGQSMVAGALEFSKGSFSTRGRASAERIGFDRWNVTAVLGNYDYRFPEKRLTFNKLSAGIFGGAVEGSITVDSLPGPSRVGLSLSYKNIDGTLLARDFPWDPKYRIESRIAGNVGGWFEGRIERFEFIGDAALDSAMKAPEDGVLSLPLDGNLSFILRPGQTNLSNANVHFLSTSLQADGSIIADNLNLKVRMASSDLKNLHFLYADANGTGSFDGVLSGPVKTPTAEGVFDLQRYKYRDWTIQQAAGMARLDTGTNTATLRDVRALQGESQITLNGTAALDGKTVDIRIQTARLRAEDTAPFVKRPFGGVLSGAIHLTSLNPLRFDGDVRATGIAFEGQTLQEAQSHVQYDDPTITLRDFTAADNGSSVSGRATYNTTTEAMTFAARINSVDFKRLRSLGMPEGLEGRILQADLTGSGTPKRPEVDGNARLQNLMFQGEAFPTARVDLSTTGSIVDLKLSETRNLEFSAQIDTAKGGYPFKAQTRFNQYSIERLAGFTRGSLVVSGDAALNGSLNDLAHISGQGHINPVNVEIQGQTLRSTKAFAFDFNSERLKLIDDVSLVSANGTQLSMNGTIGLTPGSKLDLDVKGQIDAALLAASDTSWKIAGDLDLDCQIGGTLAKPDLHGEASFSDLSIAREGLTSSLTELKGIVIFDERRVTLNSVEGRSNGGTVRLTGTGVIEGATIAALNIQVAASGVRVRYPTGMRSVIDGTLSVSGTMAAPTISGDLQIQSLTFNSSFDEFIGLFQTVGVSDTTSPFGNTRLSLRVVGNRNISIRNELATAEARVDLSVKGTVARPALTGHVETSGGSLLFQGKTYTVTRGTIDFVDPMRIDPAINIQAETTVRSYQVFLSISGRMNRLLLNLRSVPPLPQLDIVNLIAGSKTTDELAQAAKPGETAPTGEQIFQGGAASILSDMLVSRVGSKFNLLGLDRIVRIDPYVVGAQNSTTARITLSEQITKDLTVTYSQDLASNKQQIIQIEYFVTKNISVLASKDENDVRALDLRLRRRF